MVDMELVLRVNAECPVREIGEGLVIMAPDGATTHSLDAVGAFIWRRLDGRTSLESVVADLVDEYEVDESRARADVAGFVEQLLAAGLVEPA